ncbi:hypothetical protein E4U41_003615 [Claviceps citrina]|nr:hypothetical protein E4U41_003615 [Claviceps citrina]
MGLIASEDSSVGTSVDDGGRAWASMFVSRRMFWQIPAHLFLFTLQPVGRGGLCSTPGSPGGSASRPGTPREESLPSSPFRPWQQQHSRSPSGAGAGAGAGTGGASTPTTPGGQLAADVPGAPMPTTVSTMPAYPLGPYFSSSHLPTYYPPPPLQYTHTDNVRHPLRPKPPRMGEVFYTRFVESAGRYLSFRVASCSPRPVPYLGPVGPATPPPEHGQLSSMSDEELLRSWFGNPRVGEFWGDYAPGFLQGGLCSRHSFPVIGLWDGVPFGYFELYWVKEDVLGRHVGGEVDDWDRGVHIMVGEEWSRGRVAAWLTSLVHWCFTADYRTMNVCLEPRIDNKSSQHTRLADMKPTTLLLAALATGSSIALVTPLNRNALQPRHKHDKAPVEGEKKSIAVDEPEPVDDAPPEIGDPYIPLKRKPMNPNKMPNLESLHDEWKMTSEEEALGVTPPRVVKKCLQCDDKAWNCEIMYCHLEAGQVDVPKTLDELKDKGRPLYAVPHSLEVRLPTKDELLAHRGNYTDRVERKVQIHEAKDAERKNEHQEEAKARQKLVDLKRKQHDEQAAREKLPEDEMSRHRKAAAKKDDRHDYEDAEDAERARVYTERKLGKGRVKEMKQAFRETKKMQREQKKQDRQP